MTEVGEANPSTLNHLGHEDAGLPGVRASSSMFVGPVTGPWAKIVLTDLKKLEKSWKNWKISWKNWKQSWKNWKPSWKIGPYMDDLYTSLQRI